MAQIICIGADKADWGNGSPGGMPWVVIEGEDEVTIVAPRETVEAIAAAVNDPARVLRALALLGPGMALSDEHGPVAGAPNNFIANTIAASDEMP